MEENVKQECSRKLSYQGPPISSKERTRRLSILLKHHGTSVSYLMFFFSYSIYFKFYFETHIILKMDKRSSVIQCVWH